MEANKVIGTEVIGTEWARQHLGKLVDRAFFNGEEFVLGKHGEPRAKLVRYNEEVENEAGEAS